MPQQPQGEFRKLVIVGASPTRGSIFDGDHDVTAASRPVKAFVPVRIRLVTPISLGRKSQVIARKGVVAHRERAAEREFGDCGFDSRLRKPRSAAALVHRVFLTGRRGWIIGKSGRKTASGFKSRTTGQPVDVPFSPFVRHIILRRHFRRVAGLGYRLRSAWSPVRVRPSAPDAEVAHW